MERRTVVSAVLAAGMFLAAGAFTVSAIGDPPPAAHIAQAQVQAQPTPALTASQQEVVHEVTTVDDVVVVTTVATEAARSIHPVSGQTADAREAQLTLGGTP
jgi:hypothetical protein